MSNRALRLLPVLVAVAIAVLEPADLPPGAKLLQAAVWPVDAIWDTPVLPRPDYLKPITDPRTQAIVTRVTNPGEVHGGFGYCEKALCRHRYSSTEAWNADQSLLVITNGCHGMCFLDGHTYAFAFHRPVGDDCKWHPTDPSLMICVRANGIFGWRPRSNDWTLLAAPKGYRELSFGPYKGNLSWDGDKLAVRARTPAGRTVAFAYDLRTGRKFADIDVEALPGKNGYCGISATGRLVACFGTTDAGIDTGHIFTLDGALIQSWTEHHRPGHGDMAIDADGRDIYVGISKADPDKWHVIKRRLDDGFVTDLSAPGYETHASTRNIRLPGWVFLSYEGARDKVGQEPGWAPYYREIVALRTDGSGRAVRIAQSHNAKQGYDSETHASPSPDGTQVIWTSNWGDPRGPVASYVARIDPARLR